MNICYQMTKSLLLGFYRDKRILVITLMMPIAMTVILAFALKPVFSTAEVPKFAVSVCNQDSGELGTQLVRTLQSMHTQLQVRQTSSVADSQMDVKTGRAMVTVDIPKGFSRAFISGSSPTIVVAASGNDSTQSDLVSDVIHDFSLQAAENISVENSERRIHHKISVPQVHLAVTSSGFHELTAGSYYAIGMMVLFLLNTALRRGHAVGYDLRSDLAKRLRAAPCPTALFVIGYVVSNFVVLGIQGGINLLCDYFILGLTLGPWYQATILVASYALSISGLSVLLSVWIRNLGAWSSISAIGGNVASILGGSLYPLYAFPKMMRWIGNVLPNGQAMTGFMSAIAGVTTTTLVTTVAYLVGLGLVATVLAGLRKWDIAN